LFKTETEKAIDRATKAVRLVADLRGRKSALIAARQSASEAAACSTLDAVRAGAEPLPPDDLIRIDAQLAGFSGAETRAISEAVAAIAAIYVAGALVEDAMASEKRQLSDELIERCRPALAELAKHQEIAYDFSICHCQRQGPWFTSQGGLNKPSEMDNPFLTFPDPTNPQRLFIPRSVGLLGEADLEALLGEAVRAVIPATPTTEPEKRAA
jgi:hypothetical protein